MTRLIVIGEIGKKKNQMIPKCLLNKDKAIEQ
jgi:hypothetical protein